ncbi:Pycsar system effector family protein [Streptomyces sp. NPDC047990]|uniref:Pycsar system effector family protein n=1 Tax=Streptomyces sp. NPDC047990 TaxID=3365496 RepID=UPI0037247037
MLGTIVAIANSEHGLGEVSGTLGQVGFWTGLVLLATSVVLAILAVLPRHGSEGRARPAHPDDFVFYGHIRHLAPEELTAGLCGHDPLPALSRQLIAMSRILWTKQLLVQVSLLTAVSGSALIAFGILAS